VSRPRKLLIAGGLALIIWGMSYGLWFAVFDEHQTLERMGGSLATAFAAAAERKLPEAQAALDDYAATRFEYVREVDVHSHWSGLAMLLIVLGVVFDRVGYDERKRMALAVVLLVGAVIFPLGVILQTFDRGPLPRAIAVAGSGMLIAALAAVTAGFMRRGEK
jgi:dipeptide/tripeptide permease